MAVDSSYMIAPGETQSAVDQRRKLAMLLHQQAIAPQEIKHWTQGLAQLANAGITGYEMHSLDQKDKEETAKGNEMLANFLLGGSASLGSGVTPSAGVPSAAGVSTASTKEKIYENDEPSPLDPPSGADRTRMIATILGESANQGPVGMNAVGSVIRNRAVAGNYGGDTPSGVVTAKNQFEPWNTPEGRAKMAAMLTNPQLLAKADAAIASAYGEGGQAPNDPTNGATHFFAPKAQAALGRPVPAWGAGPGQMIGDHKFIGGKAGVPVQVAGEVPTSDPAALPPNSQPVQGYAVPGGQSSAPGVPNREMLIKMLGNRRTAPLAQAIIKGQIEQQFKPSEYDFKEDGKGGIIAINKKNPSDVRTVAGDSSGVIEHAAKLEAAKTRAKLEEERAVTKPERDRQEKQVANIVTDDIDRTLAKIEKSPMTTTGVGGTVMSHFGGTEARDVKGLLDTVKANAGFQELNKMRQSSPTGGALGAVTVEELKMLQATIGNLEQSQTAEQLKDNLRRVKNAYLDIIHGPGNGPRELLNYKGEGSISSGSKPSGGTSGTTKSGLKWSVQ